MTPHITHNLNRCELTWSVHPAASMLIGIFFWGFNGFVKRQCRSGEMPWRSR